MHAKKFDLKFVLFKMLYRTNLQENLFLIKLELFFLLLNEFIEKNLNEKIIIKKRKKLFKTTERKEGGKEEEKLAHIHTTNTHQYIYARFTKKNVTNNESMKRWKETSKSVKKTTV